MGYYPGCIEILTRTPYRGGETVSGGQFDWGGRLLKCNGGAQVSSEWLEIIRRV